MKVNICGSHNAQFPVRGLLDVCSQSTYIDEELINKFSLPTYEVYEKLVINTMSNKTELQDYKVAKIRIYMPKFSKTNEIILHAIVILNLSLSFKVPGLKNLANKLLDSDYHLANDFYSDLVEEIGLLVGSPHFKLFELHNYNIGQAECYQSPFGIILKGISVRFFTFI